MDGVPKGTKRGSLCRLLGASYKGVWVTEEGCPGGLGQRGVAADDLWVCLRIGTAGWVDEHCLVLVAPL